MSAIRIPRTEDDASLSGASMGSDLPDTPTSAHNDDGAGGTNAAIPAIQIANQLPVALQVYYALCGQYGTQPLGSMASALAYPVSTVQFEKTISTRDMLVLAHILEYNATVSALDFSRCSIGNHGCYPLAHVLATNSYLRTLDLSDNDIGEHGAVAIAKGLLRNSSVERVILRGNRIGLAGASGLARVVLKHPRLQVLDVCNNDLRVRGAQELVGALQQRQAKRAKQIAAQASDALDRAVAEAEVIGGPGARTEAGKALNHTANRVLASIIPDVDVRYSGNFVSWEVYNSIIHGIGLALALFGSVPLLARARGSGHLGHLISATAYVCGIAGFFLSSTLGHSLFFMDSTTSFLRQMDKLSIFVLVAGTYSPFMSVNFSHLWWSRLFLLYIWGIALVGIALAASIKTSDWTARFLRITMYFVIGWSALVPLSLGWACFHTEGLLLLFVGGCIYSIGILFYLRERLFPNQLQGLWYWLVLLASAMHFAAVFSHVSPMPLCGAVDPPPMFHSDSTVMSLASWFGIRSWFDSPFAAIPAAVTHACRTSLLALHNEFGDSLKPVADAVAACAAGSQQVCHELPMPAVRQAWMDLGAAGPQLEAIGRDASLQQLCSHWNGTQWLDLDALQPVDLSSGAYEHPVHGLDRSPVWSTLLSFWYGKQKF